MRNGRLRRKWPKWQRATSLEAAAAACAFTATFAPMAASVAAAVAAPRRLPPSATLRARGCCAAHEKMDSGVLRYQRVPWQRTGARPRTGRPGEERRCRQADGWCGSGSGDEQGAGGSKKRAGGVSWEVRAPEVEGESGKWTGG